MFFVTNRYFEKKGQPQTVFFVLGQFPSVILLLSERTLFLALEMTFLKQAFTTTK